MIDLLSSAIALFIALVFLRAFMHKALDFTQFQGFLSDYRILPPILVFPGAVALAAGEFGAFTLSLFPETRVLGILTAIVLLTIYAAVIGMNIWRGHRHIECGCGGAPQRLDHSLIWRNGLLIALATLPLATPQPMLTGPGTAAVIMAAMFLFLFFILSEKINTNRLHRTDNLQLPL